MNTKGFQRRGDPEGGRDLSMYITEKAEVKVMLAYHGVRSNQI